MPVSPQEESKGLIEFHSEVLRVLTLLPGTIQQVTEKNESVMRVVEKLSRKIKHASSDPIRWYERLFQIKSTHDRLLKKSASWGKTLASAIPGLRVSVEVYINHVNHMIQNLTGYVEFAPLIEAGDVEAFRTFRGQILAALNSVEGFRASVVEVRRARIIGAMNSPLEQIEEVLAGLIDSSRSAVDSLESIIAMSEAKVDHRAGE